MDALGDLVASWCDFGMPRVLPVCGMVSEMDDRAAV